MTDTQPRRQPGEPLPESVTMPLLTRITQQSLDEDYVLVAERKRREAGGESGGQRPERRVGPRRTLTVVAVLAFGLLVSMAAVQTAQDQDVDEAGREVLIRRIEEGRDAAGDLHRQIDEVSQENTEADATYGEIGQQLQAWQQRQRQLAEDAGFAAESGPGVRVVVDNPPGVDYSEQEKMVQDHDLAGLINGLWQAGATAISVNGHRVTALSAVRNSGPVIRINGVSLNPPYEVLALGDTRTLQANFAQTDSGRTFRTVTTQLGMPVSMDNVDDLDVPAAPESMMKVKYAEPLTATQKSED